MSKTMQIFVMDKEQQRAIKKELTKALRKLGYKGEELDEYVSNGMDGRLCDLEEVMNIRKFL